MSTSTVSLEDAQSRLSELIEHLGPGDEVLITRDNEPIARLIPQQPPARQGRRPGSAVGKLTVLSEDDEHLKDFEDYMS